MYVGKLPPDGLKLGELTETFPPEGDSVPDVEELVPIEPADAFEKDLIKAFVVSTEEIVTEPAEAVEPRCTDLINEVVAGKVVSPIMIFQPRLYELLKLSLLMPNQ